MKRAYYALVLAFASVAVHAQDATAIKITGTKFPFVIMQQWIDAYAKIHPGIKFELSKMIPADSADIFIAAHSFEPGELKENQSLIALNRYAQLPIVNDKRPDLQALQQNGFSITGMANIFFAPDTAKTDGFNAPVNIYKRDKNVCATRSFAENVTGKQKDVYGVNVTGDDRALSAAVKNDVAGISYNNLGLIYDLKTRKIADSLAVVPIDLNNNGSIDDNEKIYNSLDEVLDFLSAGNNGKIPEVNVNVVINKNTITKEALLFLGWIITGGQQYNRQYGFLNLDKSEVSRQQSAIGQLINGITKNN